jgi:hypothetical protein
MAVSPSPTNKSNNDGGDNMITKEQVFDSVARLGGTFVIQDDTIIYEWKDVIPGDTPDIDRIMEGDPTTYLLWYYSLT